MNTKTIQKNTKVRKSFVTPRQLRKKIPLHPTEEKKILQYRKDISRVIHRDDTKLLVVCGPCSIHDTQSAIEYARKLRKISIQLQDRLLIVMRAYFEKPRTVFGWKGLINDPDLDGSFRIEKGLETARSLLVTLNRIGLPLGSEILDTNIPQYLEDLFSWSAIGARTVESQIHREIASGLSMPVGFKNNTHGSVSAAINAIQASRVPHAFVGINPSGRVSLHQTNGNKNGHLILRGGKRPNYHTNDIIECERKIAFSKIPINIMVDCSHGNSNKNHRLQMRVSDAVLKQINSGRRSIIGLMLESHLHEGNQTLKFPTQKMQYGVSVTDACIGWNDTKRTLFELYEKIKNHDEY